MKARALEVMTSSENQNHGTPRGFFRWLHQSLGFHRDVCAEKWNAKLPRYFSPEDDGLRQHWGRTRNFCNPVYDAADQWTRKAMTATLEEGAITALLMASRVDTDWFINLTESKDYGRQLKSFRVPETRVWWMVYREAIVGVYHHDQRLIFELENGEQDSAPFPSSVIMLFPPRSRVYPKPAPRRILRNGFAALDAGIPLRHAHLFDRPSLLRGGPHVEEA